MDVENNSAVTRRAGEGVNHRADEFSVSVEKLGDRTVSVVVSAVSLIGGRSSMPHR